MQEVVTVPGTPYGQTSAEPSYRSRVSWGAVMAGTVTILAVTVILWALALAIVSLVLRPIPVSLERGAVALWICAMVATLVGAYVGGMVAGGWSRFAGRTGAMAHGFVAWGLALLVSFVFDLYVMGGSFGVTTIQTMEDAQAAGGYAGRGAFGYLAGASWSWFGTWAVAGLLAVAGAGMAARRRRILTVGEEPIFERQPPVKPLTPAPTS
jgi:hypothetical protein